MATKETKIKEFLDGYIEAALWASIDPDTEEPLDKNFSKADLAPETLKQAKADVMDFMINNAPRLRKAIDNEDVNYDLAMAGVDFFLSRNGHGSGYFDRGLGKVGDSLQDAARIYGSVDFYPGDDGLIHST